MVMTLLRFPPTFRYIYLTTRNMIAGHRRNGWKWDKRMEFGNLSRARHFCQHGMMSISVSNQCICIIIRQVSLIVIGQYLLPFGVKQTNVQNSMTRNQKLMS